MEKLDDLYRILKNILLQRRLYEIYVLNCFYYFGRNVFLYKSKCIQDIKEDALETIAKSRKIENTNVFASGKIDTLFRAVLRVFAPLL